jgi:hypothetical protein
LFKASALIDFIFINIQKIPNIPNVKTNKATKVPNSLNLIFGSSGSANKESQDGHLYASESIIFPQNGQLTFSLILNLLINPLTPNLSRLARGYALTVNL